VADLAINLEPSVEDRLLQAESQVRGFCGWHIAPSRSETVTFDRPTGERLMLPSLYVTSVDSVTIDGVPQVLDSDYRVHRNGWISRLPYGSGWSGDLVEVTFTHGYSDPPASVTAAVQALASNAVTAAGLSRKTVGPFTDVYELPGDLLARLGAYRIVQVA
jgi:hypothetical protein